MSNDATTHNCGACKDPDYADVGMVGCDSCNVWFHYTCAGVSPGVVGRPWKCHTCLNPLGTTSLNTGATQKSKTAAKKKKGEDSKSNRSNAASKAGEIGPKNVPVILAPEKISNDPAKNVGMARSTKTTSSNARAQLALQHLEEETLLEKQKMDEERRQLEEEKIMMMRWPWLPGRLSLYAIEDELLISTERYHKFRRFVVENQNKCWKILPICR